MCKEGMCVCEEGVCMNVCEEDVCVHVCVCVRVVQE